MPRTRELKAQFFTDGALNKLSLPARFLFAALWCLADREGRLADVPDDIEMFAFPRDQMDADALLNELAPRFITRYEVDGERYIQVNNFSKHQNVHPREMMSKIPPIPNKACQGMQLHGVTNLGEQLHGVSRQGMQSPPVTSGTSGTSGTSVPSGTSDKDNGGGGNAREDWNPFGAGERPEITVEAYIANKLATPVNATMVDDLADFEAQGLELEAVRYAVDLSLNAGSPRWDYTRGIIQRWLRTGVKTLDGARAEQKRHDEEKAKTVQSVHSRASPRQDNRSARYLELAEEMERNGQG
jgi:hypothetical protein